MSQNPYIPDYKPKTDYKRWHIFMLVVFAGFSASYWINMIWFYLKDRWGEDPLRNLVYNAGFGLAYTLGCLLTTYLSRTLNARPMLLISFATLIFLTAWSAFSVSAAAIGVVILLHAFIVTFTWPNMEMLMVSGLKHETLGRHISMYNLAWAGTSAIAYPIAGWLYDFHPITLFAVPIFFWFITFGVVVRFVPEINPGRVAKPKETPNEHTAHDTEIEIAQAEHVPVETVHRMRDMSRWGNLATYVLISAFMPMFPALSARLGFGEDTKTAATLFGALWMLSRVLTFVGLGRWHGWHFRPGMFHAAMLAMPISFGLMTLSGSVVIAGAAQVVLGVAIGLIYSSSLFYSMHGETETGEAAIHETVIGVGIFVGPLLAAGSGWLARTQGMDEIAASACSIIVLLSVIWLWLLLRDRRPSSRISA